jgi:hypothetical protein
MSARNLKKWNLRNLSIQYGLLTFNGNFGASGALTWAPNEDDYKLLMSADGVGTRCQTNNMSGKFTLKLAQSNEDNALLSAQRLVDLLSSNGAGVAPFIVKDREGSTLITAESAWCMRCPDAEFQQEITERGWTIETDNAIVVIGGN